MSQNNNEEKKCRVCGRIIVGESKHRLCPDCAATGKTIKTTAGAIALGVIVKNAKKIVKITIDCIKNIKI